MKRIFQASYTRLRHVVDSCPTSSCTIVLNSVRFLSTLSMNMSIDILKCKQSANLFTVLYFYVLSATYTYHILKKLYFLYFTSELSMRSHNAHEADDQVESYSSGWHDVYKFSYTKKPQFTSGHVPESESLI